MTREEARKHMMLWVYSLDDMPPKQVMEALTMAADALRPVSREQVEKAWRGEWVGVPKMGVYDMECSKCGYSPGVRFFSSEFCPACGAPMTDKAVEMVMERMEAAHEEN